VKDLGWAIAPWSVGNADWLLDVRQAVGHR